MTKQPKLAVTCSHCSRGSSSAKHGHSHALHAVDPAAVVENIYRLPRTVIPSHYDISLSPDGASRIFSGEVAITVDVLSPVSTIKLNAKHMVVSSALARHSGGTVLEAAITLDEDKEMVELAFAGVVGKGQWQVELKFAGRHGNDGQGFFATTWSDSEKNEHTMLCTQFESADARSAFPCFDEPDLKATFKVRLIVGKELTALSNGDIVSVSECSENPAKKVVEFEPTLKMSTYVVCFVVGELVSSKPFYVNGKRMQIWGIPGSEDKMAFGQQVASFGLDYFETYFEIPYPFGSKIDLVAIPGFAWGGMENVGLLVFQPRLLLIKEGATEEAKSGVAQIIMHELAHQWFGDLVTMRWWNGLWLNESFATFMQYKAADAFNDKWRCWDSFSSQRDRAFWTDSVRASHPIEETVERGGDAIMLVDDISYQKGCSVLYQTERLIGDEVLRQGIVLYLTKHAFGNTESFDLWESMEEACRKNGLALPIRAIMEAWIFQVGFPEVMVSEGKKPGEIVLRQRPFLLLARGRKARKLWPIPMNIRVKGTDGVETTTKVLFDTASKRLQIGEYDVVQANADGCGFYRTRYSPTLLAKLVDSGLKGAEIASVIGDNKAHFNACMIGPEAYLAFLLQVAKANDLVGWWQTMDGLDLLTRMCDQADRRALAKLVAGKLRAQAQEQAWNVQSDSEELLPVMSNFKPYHLNLNGLVQKLSRTMLRSWKQDKQSLTEMQAAQAAMILHFGRARLPREFRDLQKPAQHATPLDSQKYLLTVLERHAAECAANGKGTKVDIFTVLADIILQPGRSNDTVVAQFLEEWPTVLDGETPPIQIVYKVQYGGLTAVNEENLEADLKRCFRKHPSRQAHAVIRRTMERIRANVVMRQTQSAALKALLKTK